MIKPVLRYAVATCVFGLAFVVNPAWVTGCASGDDEVDPKALAMIEADLLERLDAVNETGSFMFEHEGTTYEALLVLAQTEGKDTSAALRPRKSAPSFTRSAHACGTHTFRQSASACATTYALEVEGTLTVRRLGEDEAVIARDIPVHGSITDWGETSLGFGDQSTLALTQDGDNTPRLYELEAYDLDDSGLDILFEQSY
jgi:hypothetical protein